MPTIVQTNYTTVDPGAVSSFTLSMGTTTAGNGLVIGIRTGSSVTVWSVSNTGGDTWASGTVNVSGGQRMQFWYVTSCKGHVSDTATITLATSTSSCAAIEWEVLGAITLDQQAGGINGSSGSVTSSSYTTTSANEVIFALGANNAVYTVAPTWGFQIAETIVSSQTRES